MGRRSGIRLRCRAAAAAALDVGAPGFDGEGDAVADQLDELDVAGLEPAGRHRPDVEHPDDPALDHQGHADERLDAPFPQDGVEHVGVVDVLDDDRRDLGGDPARRSPRPSGRAPLAAPPPRCRSRRMATRSPVASSSSSTAAVSTSRISRTRSSSSTSRSGTSRWVRAASVTDSMRRSRSVSSSCASPRAATSASVASGLSSIGSPSAGRPVTATRPDEATVRAPRRSDRAGRGPAPGGTGPGVRTGTTAKATASPSGRSRPLGYPTGRMPNRFWCRSVSRGIRIGVR